MAPPVRSGTQKFFLKLTPVLSRCKLYGKDVKTSGNTTNLKNHLLRAHKDQKFFTSSTETCTGLEPEENVDEPDGPEPQSREEVADLNSRTPSTGRSGSSRPKNIAQFFSPIRSESEASIVTSDENSRPSSSKSGSSFVGYQMPIMDAIVNMNTLKDGGDKHGQLSTALVYMVAKDYLPLSFVENAGFRRFMKIALPLYKLPSRKSLTRLLDTKFEAFSIGYKETLSAATNLTLTCDAWTETGTVESFLGVTCHFVRNFQIISGNLGVYPLSESHTSVYLADILGNVERDWGLDPTKISCVVTDNGANIVRAVDLKYGKSKHLPCFAHTLALVPMQAIMKTPNLPQLIANVKSLVAYFKRSVSASDDLRKVQMAAGKSLGTCLKLKLEVSTRWNSCFYLLERFIELSGYIGAISLKEKHANCPAMISNSNLSELKEIILLLKPLEKVTREMSADQYITSSKIIPLVSFLNLKLTSCRPSTVLAVNFKSNLAVELDNRFKNVQDAHILAVATILDPRFKKLHFTNPHTASKAIKKVSELVQKEIQANPSATCPEPDLPRTDDVDNDDDLWGFHKSLVARASFSSNTDTAGGIPVEFRQYLNQEVSDVEEDPLRCWAVLKVVYPHVFLVAMKYLAIVGTSVPSERLFSKAGKIKTKNRNRLTGSRLSKILFLNSLPDGEWGYK